MSAEQVTAQPMPRDAWRGGSSYEASMLRNLLAVIHGDGGQYVEQHGLDKALHDAEALVVSTRVAVETAEAALKRLSFAAQTTGGTAGPDAELMAAIAQAETALVSLSPEAA